MTSSGWNFEIFKNILTVKEKFGDFDIVDTVQSEI